MFVYVDLVVVPATPPLFIPTATPTRDPKSYIVDAAGLFAAGKLKAAMDAYQQAIQAEPQNPTNYIALARIQVFDGKYQDAQVNAENAILLDKKNSLALAVKGWALGMQGSYLEAEAALKDALDLDANNALAHAYLAEVLADEADAGKGTLGTMDRAAEESRKAVALDDNLLEAHRARGLILELTANNQEAVQEFNRAIQLNENLSDLHLALGRNLVVLEQYVQAVEEFSKAYALNPTDPYPNLYISRTYAKIGEWAKSVQYAEQAAKDGPSDPYIQGNLGSAYYKLEQYDKAIIHLRLAVRGGTTDTGEVVKGLPLDYNNRIMEFYSRYGLALARVNQCNEAIQVAQAIQQGVKDDETSVYNAGEIINVCQENITGTRTPTPEATKTPVPKK